MPGITALEKTLIGTEATAGGSTDAPTTHWRGMGDIVDRRELVFPPERVGKIGGTLRSYIPRSGGEVPLEGDATYEQLCHLFNAGISLVTPTTDLSSASIRTWTVPAASSDPISSSDLQTLVVEHGDNIAVETARYCFVREMTLTGRQGEAMQISATLQSREPSTASAFTAVGDTDFDNPSESILFSKVALYIDPSSDAIGTSQKSETILDMSLRFATGWVALDAKDGRVDFSSIKRVDDELVLDVTFEHNSVATAEKDAWRAQTERGLRLKFTGTALSTTDATAAYDTMTFVINLYGKWLTFGAEGMEEQDGDNVYRGTFKVGWSSIAAAKASFVLANQLATLP